MAGPERVHPDWARPPLGLQIEAAEISNLKYSHSEILSALALSGLVLSLLQNIFSLC